MRQATTSTRLERLQVAAREASRKPLPSGRGEISKLVPKAEKKLAPMKSINGLGPVKMLLCTHKSYLLMHNSETNKWPLLCESTHASHAEIISHLFLWCQQKSEAKAELTKEHVLAQRAVITKQVKYLEPPLRVVDGDDDDDGDKVAEDLDDADDSFMQCA